MAIGIIADPACVVVGGLLGAAVGKHIPARLKLVLPMSFSVGAMAMGIVSIVRLNSLPAVILALLVGTVIGVFLDIEKAIRTCGSWLAIRLSGSRPQDEEHRKRLEVFTIALILFCTGTTGIYGAIHSAVTGDSSILLAKAILDLFTNFIFATTAGVSVSLLGIPMFIIFSLLYVSAGFLMPLTTPEMLGDFASLGGLLILATGFRMAEMKIFHVADMLPSLVLIFPISYYWTLWM